MELAVSEIFEAAIELGGTLSGEHGIGTLKSPYMEMELGITGVNMMKKIKEAWDPNNILNQERFFLIKARQGSCWLHESIRQTERDKFSGQ